MANVEWRARAQFFAIAAQMMRRILVDYAKNRKATKRGGEAENLPLDEALTIPAGERDFDLLDLDEALDRLAEIDEIQARIVELRYFSGLSIAETAEVVGLSATTVKQNWNMAKAWLYHKLTPKN